MSWFLHNAVADLYGPYFLLFYAAVIVVSIVAARRSIRSADWTRELDPLEVPAKLDPYEVAYLRGGANEVTRVAIASLIQRGVLQITEQKARLSVKKWIDLGRTPSPGELAPIENAIRKWSGFPAEPRAIFAAGGLAARIEPVCDQFEDELTERGLLAPREELRSLARRLWSFGILILVGLGGYKLAVAHAKGHHNVGLLWFMMIAGGLFYTIACRSLPRLTARGKDYLYRLKLAYSGLRPEIDAGGDWTVNGAEDSPTPRGGRAAAASSECLLLVGIFGIPALAGTPLSDMTTMFRMGPRRVNGNGGCGGASGGCGGGGGGGGCGGGGGGGCGGGGGGCGGGGCGGCGGG